MLIDSHCHLHDREFFGAEEAEEMLRQAFNRGVERIICIGTSHEDSLAAREFASKHENVYWTYGIHPENTHSGRKLEICFSRASGGYDRGMRGAFPVTTGESDPVPRKAIFQFPIAIGEVGLDYHYEGYDRAAQIRLFEEMLQLAADNNLPLSFHVREAFSDFFPVVANFSGVRGVVHSFTDSKKTLKRILTETDFYVGVNGLATYSTLATPPLERILLETDAPFLAPVPHCGETNQPAYVADVADWLAKKLEIPLEEAERVTTDNAMKLFGVG